MPPRSDLVRPFEYEPDLLRRLPSEDATRARERVVAESLVLSPGALDSPLAPEREPLLGYLVLEGVLVRRYDFAGRRAVELVGPGDVVRPFRRDDPPTALPCHASWTIGEQALLALLDHRFERELVRLPGVFGELLDRLSRRAGSLAVQLAIAQMPRLDLRLLCLFWRLADRWGIIGPGGVSIDLRLSQTTIAQLVSASRSSVNAALRDLRERGRLLTPRPGRWVLSGAPPSELLELELSASELDRSGSAASSR